MVRLDPEEIADLGDFLSRRLPDPGPEGWAAHLLEAQSKGRLFSVIDGASRRCDDARLREVRALLAPRGGRTGLALAATALLALALSGVVGGVALAARDVPMPPPPPPVAAAPVVVAPKAEVAAPPVAPPPAALADHPCARAGGDVVGWWYAGDRSPGRAGDLVVMARDANVRAAPPGEDNRFDARTRIRCVLHVGDRLRLSLDPRLVPPGAYWVPVRAQDLQR